MRRKITLDGWNRCLEIRRPVNAILALKSAEHQVWVVRAAPFWLTRFLGHTFVELGAASIRLTVDVTFDVLEAIWGLRSTHGVSVGVVIDPKVEIFCLGSGSGISHMILWVG